MLSRNFSCSRANHWSWEAQWDPCVLSQLAISPSSWRTCLLLILSVLAVHPCFSAWLCYLSEFSKYLPSSYYGRSSVRTPGGRTKMGKMTTHWEHMTGPHGKVEKYQPTSYPLPGRWTTSNYRIWGNSCPQDQAQFQWRERSMSMLRGWTGAQRPSDRGFQVHRRTWWQERQFGEAELGQGQAGRKHGAYSVSFDICRFLSHAFPLPISFSPPLTKSRPSCVLIHTPTLVKVPPLNSWRWEAFSVESITYMTTIWIFLQHPLYVPWPTWLAAVTSRGQVPGPSLWESRHPAQIGPSSGNSQTRLLTDWGRILELWGRHDKSS